MQAYGPFESKEIEVFAQGSYRNGTNVRANSDVDVCVRCMDVFFTALPPGTNNADLGLVDGTYTYPAFKNDVERALRQYLGASAVSRGNKAFDLHENTYRIDADVVPTFEHRRYREDRRYHSGAELHSERGSRIINWPEQNYQNATEKNEATEKRFKKMVRVLKRLRNTMHEDGVSQASPSEMPSYLVECLVWNVPNGTFGNNAYTEDLRAILLHLFGATKDDAGCQEWGEVNELKYLFRNGQPWTRQAANAFIVAAWHYVGFQ
jgi:hypothetical protein